MVTTLKKLLEELNIAQKTTITLRFGLEGNRTKTQCEIGTILNVSRQRVSIIESKAIKKLREPKRRRMLCKQVFEPTEEFIKTYFQIHDVFYSEEEPQISGENIKKLTDICEKQREREEEKEKKLMEIFENQRKIEEKQREKESQELHEKGIWGIDEMGFTARTYNGLSRAGLKTTADLLERFEERVDLNTIINLGIKSQEEIIEKVHSLGLKFKYEEENIKNSSNESKAENATMLELEQKDIEQQCTIVENEESLTDSFSTIAEKISNCDTNHREICKRVEELKLQKKGVSQKIEQLLNEINNGDVTKEIATTMAQVYKMLQEQRKTLEDLEKAIVEAQDLEKSNREERTKLTEKITGMIQGGN